MAKKPRRSLMDLHALKSKADKQKYPSYVVSMLLKLFYGDTLDGRQQKKLQILGLMDEKHKLTFYGRMVTSRLVTQDRKRQSLLVMIKEKKEDVPLWRK